MATVYLATDLRLERRVAIKIMHGHLSDDTKFKERFIQEARSAAPERPTAIRQAATNERMIFSPVAQQLSRK